MSAAKICPDLSFMNIHGQVNKDLATFFAPVVVFVLFNTSDDYNVIFVFLG